MRAASRTIARTSQDPENFSWKYNNKSSSSPDNTNFIFKPENHQNSDMLILDHWHTHNLLELKIDRGYK